jgi:guanine nucleotide-binding protein subunit alpha
MCDKGHGTLKRILLDGLCTLVWLTHSSLERTMLTATSFFDEVGRIAAPDYVPHEADVLRARTKTTGIYETRFSMGQLSIQ